jgi:hypothetical protein
MRACQLKPLHSRLRQIPSSFIDISAAPNERCGQPYVSGLPIYALNRSTDRRIAVNIEYQTVPPDRSFVLYDANLSRFDKVYPDYFEHWLAPGERRLIGCTSMPQSVRANRQFEEVAIEATIAGALFVSPNEPRPPESPAEFYIALLPERLPNDGSCDTGSRPRGLFHVLNFHPNRTIRSRFNVQFGDGSLRGLISTSTEGFQASGPIACTQPSANNPGILSFRDASYTSRSSTLELGSQEWD